MGGKSEGGRFNYTGMHALVCAEDDGGEGCIIRSSLCDRVEYVVLSRRNDKYPLPTGLFVLRRGLSCILFGSLARVSNSSFQIDG